jgi:3-oxoacyl-[acyl-carrier protein] reductase
MDLGIAGRAALVCGSSAGLGRAIADALAAEGCRVAVNGRDEERLNHAVALLAQRHDTEIAGFRADVSVPAQATDLVEQVVQRFGSVDVLVCNAAGPPAAPFASTPAEGWQAALDLNLLSTIHLCRAALPSMRQRGWGRVICLTSVAARQPIQGLILSTTARAGVLGFAKCLSDEVAAEGITVNAVCPGYMNTDRVTDLVAQRAAQTLRDTNQVLAAYVADIPAGRMGEPEELASAVAFLASDRARYITGVALQVDGGYIRSIM